jgi:hypothetical protein
MARRIIPRKILTLEKPGSKTSVQLMQKHGVWFIEKVSGAMNLHEFTDERGWGITQHAINRAARHLNLTIKLDPEGPQ